MFKDEYLFYRFRVDDGSFFVEPELEIYQQGILLHQRYLLTYLRINETVPDLAWIYVNHVLL